MSADSTLRTAIKNFAFEAERFKIVDLARILNQPPKKLVKILKDMIAEGEIKGIFTTKNDEFVITERLKTEILRIFKNPSVIE